MISYDSSVDFGPRPLRQIIPLKLKIPDDIVFRILDDEAVILNVANGIYFGLDSVGTRMWQLMSEHRSTDPVVGTLLDEYEVGEDRLRYDLDQLIRQLVDKGIVQIDAENTPAPD